MQLLGSVIGWLFGGSMGSLISWTIFSYLLAYVLYFAVVVSQRATLMGWAVGGCAPPPIRTRTRARTHAPSSTGPVAHWALPSPAPSPSHLRSQVRRLRSAQRTAHDQLAHLHHTAHPLRHQDARVRILRFLRLPAPGEDQRRAADPLSLPRQGPLSGSAREARVVSKGSRGRLDGGRARGSARARKGERREVPGLCLVVEWIGGDSELQLVVGRGVASR